jgi:hypothetical protein
MNKTVTKDEALSRFDAELARWKAALDAIGPERIAEPGVMGDWPAADLVAHVSGWQWKMLASMRVAVAGGEYPLTPWPDQFNNPDNWEEDGDFEAINQWIHEQVQTAPPDSLVAASLRQWAEIREIIAGLSEEQINDPNLFPRLEGRSISEVLTHGDLFEHVREHLDDDLDPWLERNGRRG